MPRELKIFLVAIGAVVTGIFMTAIIVYFVDPDVLRYTGKATENRSVNHQTDNKSVTQQSELGDQNFRDPSYNGVPDLTLVPTRTSDTINEAPDSISELFRAERTENTRLGKLLEQYEAQVRELRQQLSRFCKQSFMNLSVYQDLYDPENKIDREQLQHDGLRLFEELPINPGDYSSSEVNDVVVRFARFLAQGKESRDAYERADKLPDEDQNKSDLLRQNLFQDKENFEAFTAYLRETLGESAANTWRH